MNDDIIGYYFPTNNTNAVLSVRSLLEMFVLSQRQQIRAELVGVHQV